MQTVMVGHDRSPHWIGKNHQTRMPKRWVAFDTESKAHTEGDLETQTWQVGAAKRWRTDLKTGDHAESAIFDTPESLWQWVTEFCKPGHRTVVAAHNLGHDIRISGALGILPKLGWRLEWCNLDRNVSSMTWRSERGTLVFMDTWTWLPMELRMVAPTVGLEKLPMPSDHASRQAWETYCLRDAEIVYRCVNDINAYIKREALGNWQPTGAGMAYATWRHKYMNTKVLVHDDVDALTAERAAMHTGRAEAWQHGVLDYDVWTEVDLRNAYTVIAAECELPVKLKMKVGAISGNQYERLGAIYRVLGYCRVDTSVPVVPFHTGTRTIWPTGTFNTWLWDTEISALLEAGAKVRIRSAYCYTKGPILQDWAHWVLSVLRADDMAISPVVKTWLKHCARALIGRISLRCPTWKLFGGNPDGVTGITHDTDIRTGKTSRLMHIGDRTFIETDKSEGKDSLPQVTGWIMAECRVRLWRGMSAAGLSNLAHVDTDAVLVNKAGLAALRAAEGARFGDYWAVKGSARRLIVYGPRNYRQGTTRKAAGVPKRADEILPNVFRGERWTSMSAQLEAGKHDIVTVRTEKWEYAKSDPRRLDAPGAGTATVAVQLSEGVSSSVSSSPRSGDGA